MSETLDRQFRAKLAWCAEVGIEFDGTPDEDEMDEAINDYVSEHWPDVADPFGYAIDYQSAMIDRIHDQQKDT